MEPRRTIFLMPFLAGAGLVVACQPSTPTASPQGVSSVAAVSRWYQAQQVARGAEVFRQNCAACHGANAEGAPNWQNPGPDGKYPPPPLNGTAHAWHHPIASLKDTIRHGTARIGGSMPPWKDKLTDADIEAAIAWFQSHWPDELYAAWSRMDEESRRKLRGS